MKAQGSCLNGCGENSTLKNTEMKKNRNNCLLGSVNSIKHLLVCTARVMSPYDKLGSSDMYKGMCKGTCKGMCKGM